MAWASLAVCFACGAYGVRSHPLLLVVAVCGGLAALLGVLFPRSGPWRRRAPRSAGGAGREPPHAARRAVSLGGVLAGMAAAGVAASEQWSDGVVVAIIVAISGLTVYGLWRLDTR